MNYSILILHPEESNLIISCWEHITCNHSLVLKVEVVFYKLSKKKKKNRLLLLFLGFLVYQSNKSLSIIKAGSSSFISKSYDLESISMMFSEQFDE